MIDAIEAAKGKRITGLRLDPDMNCLLFWFEDGTRLRIFDDGQSCCENRYMRTDDKLDDYVGAIFEGIELRDAPPIAADGYRGEHEVQFLAIRTSSGQFVMSNHNEHNGYYGGFSLVADSGQQ